MMKLRTFTLLLLFSTFMLGRAEDDDMAAEIAIDLLIGVGIAVCEQFVICNILMVTMAVVALIITIIALCAGEITLGDLCNRRSVRGGFTTAMGYGGARSLFGRRRD